MKISYDEIKGHKMHLKDSRVLYQARNFCYVYLSNR